MSLVFEENIEQHICKVTVSGKLHKEDYEHFVPEIEAFIEKHGKLRIMFVMHDFHGWDLSAMWEDTKFDLKHWRDIEKLAMVGETAWQKGMAVFCKPFTSAKIRYFEPDQQDEAAAWLRE